MLWIIYHRCLYNIYGPQMLEIATFSTKLFTTLLIVVKKTETFKKFVLILIVDLLIIIYELCTNYRTVLMLSLLVYQYFIILNFESHII